MRAFSFASAYLLIAILTLSGPLALAARADALLPSGVIAVQAIEPPLGGAMAKESPLGLDEDATGDGELDGPSADDEAQGNTPQGEVPSQAGKPADGPDDQAKAKALPGASDAIADTAVVRAKHLDNLFAELKRQPSAEAAARTAQAIEEEWSRSGSATVDLMLQWAGTALAADNPGAALDLLDQAVMLKPDCAEAWNRRATVNYTRSDYGKSIADIEKVLTLEPRHFGALMGLGMILEETDRKKQALEAYTKALAIYPTLKTAQDGVARLADELSGQGI